MDFTAATPPLTTVLGIDLAEVTKISRFIDKLELETDEDNIDSQSGTIASTLKLLIHSQFDKLTLIEIEKRRAFYDSLEMRIRKQQSRIPEMRWNEMQKQLHDLLSFCKIDFNRKPLSFAREALDKWNILEECEQNLLGTINMLRREEHLGNIFEKQFLVLSHRRRKIVIACMGAVKSAKSSFVNYLLGANVCPVGTEETTARLTTIKYGERTVVKLCSPDYIIKKEHVIDDMDQLRQIARNLIQLEGNDRKSELCKDVVVIELNMQGLCQIELWDIPGIDENATLTSIVHDILLQADIIFAVTPLNDSLRESFVDTLKPWLQKKRNEDEPQSGTTRQPLVCFMASKTDLITNNKLSNLTCKQALEHLFNRIKTEFEVDLGLEVESSNQLIPLCTHRSFNMADFLHSYHDFTTKSSQFFSSAVSHITNSRLSYLIQTMHALFDYENVNRTLERLRQLIKIFELRFKSFKDTVRTDLKEPFDSIHRHVLANINDVLHKDTMSVNNTTQKSQINERVKTALTNLFGQAMQAHHQNITERLSTLVLQFFSNLDINPQQVQLVEEALQRTILANPYDVPLGCYDSRISTMFLQTVESIIRKAEECFIVRTLFFNSSNSCFDPFHLFFLITVPILTLFNEKRLAREQMEHLVESSINETMEQLQLQTQEALVKCVQSQVNAVLEELRQKTFSDDPRQISAVIKYLKEKKQPLSKMYLNILDKRFRLEHPLCDISNTMIGESNYPVYVGHLKDHDGSSKMKVAAKLIPQNEFNLQEVRYINEIKHDNIVGFYGVRQSEKKADHYEIIMQWLESDLEKYLEWKKMKKNLTGECIDAILLQIVQGLTYLHDSGFFHRDIKPPNILVQIREPQPPVCLIADFGLVHRAPLSIKGTLGYVAPELLLGGYITIKTDMYSLGATIHEILSNSGLSKENGFVQFWTEVYDQCLQNEPKDRPTCKELLEQHGRL